ncbi:hypothetical protein CSKR_200625 [Clonorchis sinensis]|uniref:Uncharacterized protein n=1 Tax=Clonorchis sinensis TaxID=79923 RepID=A0A8T1MFI9_CLOSI|nr:hypothetical protein CSKR_200625 [Clonorchis sinensis]
MVASSVYGDDIPYAAFTYLGVSAILFVAVMVFGVSLSAAPHFTRCFCEPDTEKADELQKNDPPVTEQPANKPD